MDIEELKAMIPSETVRQYVLDTGWTFTDMQKAILLHLRYMDLPLKELYSYLCDLRDKTADEELREQITTYVRWGEQAIQAFKDNGGRRCVYVLKVREKGGYWDRHCLSCGNFFDWEAAFGYGRKRKTQFEIEKYLVDGVDEFEDGTCSHHWIAKLRFNKDGGMICVSSNEIPDIERDNYHFAEMYFEVPNPFEQGDIVKTYWGDYGIVQTSQDEWKEKIMWFTDIFMSIAIFDEECGTFRYGGGVTPLDLERYQPTGTGKSTSELMDSVLICRSLVDRGQGSLDDLYAATMEYRNARKRADKGGVEKKALLKALGRGHWMTLDEIYERAKVDCDCTWDSIVSHMSWMSRQGYVQYAQPYGTNEDYYCGLSET